MTSRACHGGASAWWTGHACGGRSDSACSILSLTGGAHGAGVACSMSGRWCVRGRARPTRSSGAWAWYRLVHWRGAFVWGARPVPTAMPCIWRDFPAFEKRCRAVACDFVLFFQAAAVLWVDARTGSGQVPPRPRGAGTAAGIRGCARDTACTPGGPSVPGWTARKGCPAVGVRGRPTSRRTRTCGCVGASQGVRQW